MRQFPAVDDANVRQQATTLDALARSALAPEDARHALGLVAAVAVDMEAAGLSNDVSASELKRYREAELTHGRVAMLASLGFLVGESGFTPLFEGKIDGIGINQFWQVPTGFWSRAEPKPRCLLLL